MTIAFGNQQVIDGTGSLYNLSGNDLWMSQRFTCPVTMLGSFCRAFIGINYDGSPLMGVQGDSGGFPDGNYIVSGLYITGSTTNSSTRTIGFNDLGSLISGTIYHFLIKPAFDYSNGPGSTFVGRGAAYSGPNFFHWTSVIPGSIYIQPQDTNFMRMNTADSGVTWRNNAIPNTLSFSVNGSTSVGNLSVTAGTPLNNNIAARTIGSNSMAGQYYRMERNIPISGVFAYVDLAEANAGSLWLRIEYSGVTVGGLRNHIGSVVMPSQQTGIISTQFYANLPGSILYMWLYAPDGDTTTGSRYQVNAVVSVPAANDSYGFGSSFDITSTNNGSTVSHNTTSDLGGLWFALSGADGGGQVSSSYISTYGDNLVSYCLPVS